MLDYIQASELGMLREAGFTVGFSGESWFSPAKDTKQYWQAYALPDDTNMIFVDSEDRASRYMTREEFQEKFGGMFSKGLG